jgi:hypothetical protein
MQQNLVCVTQLGTSGVRRSAPSWQGVAALLWLAACADEHGAGAGDAADVQEDAGDAQASHHAAPEAGSAQPDARAMDAHADADAAAITDAAQTTSDVRTDDDGSSAPAPNQPHACEAAGKKLSDFISQHRSCSIDSDCAIVGDCSHADFMAIERAHLEEATRLSLQTCGAQDGPTYNAVCNANKCDIIRSVAYCGGVPQSECPAGTKRRYPGCSEPKPTFEEGCYADCTAAGNNAGCPAGYTCQTQSIDPCRGLACDACGQEVALCLPAPTCEVELALGFDGRSLVKVPSAQSTQLALWLSNRTDRTLKLSFDVPCHGPKVTGLGNYDLWSQCLAGSCAEPTQRVELTLMPREELRWRTAVVRPFASTCNPQGLAAGTYTPSFTLSNLTGAVSCGPAPTSLTVTP